MEPTRVETQEVDSTGYNEHVEGGLSEIIPNEEGAGGFRRIKPSPKCLEVKISEGMIPGE